MYAFASAASSGEAAIDFLIFAFKSAEGNKSTISFIMRISFRILVFFRFMHYNEYSIK